MIFKNEGNVRFQCGDQVFDWNPLRIDTNPSKRDDFSRVATIILNPETALPEPEAEGTVRITVGNYSTRDVEGKVLEIGAVSKAKDAPVVCKIAYRRSV